MTVGVAWIRRYGDAHELWCASDSRLTGDGFVWDDCPKLVPLPRRDAIAAFSGSTAQAYPLLLQTSNAIGAYRASRDGTLEFFGLLRHLERVINSMMRRLRIDPAVHGAFGPRPEFAAAGDSLLIGGYSRQHNGMTIRVLQYDAHSHTWRFTRPRWKSGQGGDQALHVFGDSPSRGRFLYLLRALLAERGKPGPDVHFDLEPLETLAAMLRMPTSEKRRLPAHHRPPTIGGAPQVMSIMPGADATSFAIRWWTADGPVDFLQGRRTFAYERLDVPLIEFTAAGLQVHAPGQWTPQSDRTRLMQRLVVMLEVLKQSS
jgi:hypothetical protein